nr:MAG TPA: hypothetical protein [Caudoviricetes sp.]
MVKCGNWLIINRLCTNVVIPTESHLGHSEKGVLNCFYSFYDISIRGHNWPHFIEIYCVLAKKRIENKKAAP